jgi:predicted dehydrogenase
MSDRRDFLKAALTTNLFAGNIRGANDKVQAGFIGMGTMGMGNLKAAMQQENLVPAAVCDVYEPYLQRAVEATKGTAKGYKDFRQVIADKSLDVICISTPDHWHAYMMVEACKAGKDVYVEKPISVTIEEGQLMVKAARKYNRVVQAGTMQRSQPHFQRAAEIVRSGGLGEVQFCRTWNYANIKPEGIGNPPDGEPPKDLDWNMWLGPAPLRAFNTNRWGVDPKRWSTFRYFWDYAGGWVTDWAVHLVDIVHMAFDEPLPVAAVSLGQKKYTKDNAETPDCQVITLEYPNFVCTYEHRDFNANSMFGQGYGILFHGSKATMFVDRSYLRVMPEKGSDVQPQEMKATEPGNRAHWANFLACVKSRQKPVADVEVCHRTSTACHLGNIALRSKSRVDFDPARETILQAEPRKYAAREQRKPWKITV